MMKHNLNAIMALAYRDLLKFVRDRARLVSTFIFPFIFIIAMGGSLQASFGQNMGFNFMTFIFTGVFAQTLFQSATLGIVSIIDDRENDFSQEIFVSPISRYSIVFGKILGESLVALAQGAGIIVLGLVIGVPIALAQIGLLFIVGLAVCLFGGAFGLIIVSNMKTRRSADQIFNFIMLPQFFLAGVFAPINRLPLYLDVFSRISPMRYAVDLTRSMFYIGKTEYPNVVLESAPLNLIIMGAMFGVFLVVGTLLFVRNETNR
jgi:ABC-2 type transport system permease protein